jgi:hypothetical protein
MNINFKQALLVLPLIIISCSNSDPNVNKTDNVIEEKVSYNQVGEFFYNEFMECKTGPDYSKDTLAQMMSEWREMGLSTDLLGSWSYSPALQDSGLEEGLLQWELQWTSKEAADSAWSDWQQDEDAQQWSDKYQSVLQCNEGNRSPWTFIFPYDPEAFGEFDKAGYFASSFSACNFNEGKSNEDLKLSIALYSSWLDSLEKNIGTYSYGLYFPAFQTNEVDFWFGNFHESFQTMEEGNLLWENSGADAKKSLESTATCQTANLFNSQVSYDPSNPNFS